MVVNPTLCLIHELTVIAVSTYRKNTPHPGFQGICGLSAHWAFWKVLAQIKRGLLYPSSVSVHVAGTVLFFVSEIVTWKLKLQNQPRGDSFVTNSGPCHTSPASAGQAHECLT